MVNKDFNASTLTLKFRCKRMQAFFDNICKLIRDFDKKPSCKDKFLIVIEPFIFFGMKY